MHRRGRDQAVRPDAALGRARAAAVARPAGRSDVGACLAANLSGPLRHRFGAPRDLVLGVTLVLADGTVANAGGKVVKNVAGYDLGKLVCGSARPAGLHRARQPAAPPRCPPAAATVVVETDDTAAVAATLLGSHLVPSARRRSPPRAGGASSSRAAPRPWRHRSRRSRRSSAASATTARCGRSRAHARAPRGAAPASPPASSARSSTACREAIVRPAAGVAYVPDRSATRRPSRCCAAGAGAASASTRTGC